MARSRETRGSEARSGRQNTVRREGPRKILARKIGRVCFLLYLFLLAYFLFFADWYGHVPGAQWEYHYNLVPFREIRRFLSASDQLGPWAVFLNLVGNVVGFLPFGFFLRIVSPRFRSAGRIVSTAFLFSLAVELIQLVTRSGRFDVDDMLLNTFGAAAGYLLFLVCNGLRKEVQRRYE